VFLCKENTSININYKFYIEKIKFLKFVESSDKTSINYMRGPNTKKKITFIKCILKQHKRNKNCQ
jgi:hypothetical protein